ncbi:MAG TPA: glycosyltransferase [Pyrinomonadaceae bacterium]|jgi:glucosyl-dolichyl phosphate glucuronosyltransferase
MLSVAICTYNRASLLSRVLDSVTNQIPATDEAEILIVDNGSTDGTRDLVAALQLEDNRIRYVVEPKPGIAHARNRALGEAHGEYLAFIDDDAWADPNWLGNLLAPIQSVSPRPKCVVGPVSLVWEGKRPDWFPDRFESLLCRYEMGDVPRFLDADGYLLTTNSLFHRETLLNLGGMRTDLGHRRKALLGGEDNDIFNRLIANGLGIYYQPRARVFHPVPKERQTRRFLLRRLFWDGASQPLLEGTSKDNEQAPGAWAEFYRNSRRSMRFLFETFYGLLTGNRMAAEAGFYRLVQRLGRMRTHLIMALGGAEDPLALKTRH